MPPIANTSVNALRTSMPRAVTIARFSTPARMISPYRVFFRKVVSPTRTTIAAAISRNRSFGMCAPAIVVVSPNHAGEATGRASLPQIPITRASVASPRPTVTSTCSISRR